MESGRKHRSGIRQTKSDEIGILGHWYYYYTVHTICSEQKESGTLKA